MTTPYYYSRSKQTEERLELIVQIVTNSPGLSARQIAQKIYTSPGTNQYNSTLNSLLHLCDSNRIYCVPLTLSYHPCNKLILAE